jgi:hypothetical protein
LGANSIRSMLACSSEAIEFLDRPRCQRGLLYDDSVKPAQRTYSFAEPMVLPEFSSLVQAAAQTWNAEFSARNFNAGISPGFGDVRIVFQPDAVLERNYYYTPTNELRIKESVKTSPSGYVKALFLHEFGHVLGFDQASKRDISVMSDTFTTSYRSGFSPCDKAAFDFYFKQ